MMQTPVFQCYLGDVKPLPLAAIYQQNFQPLDLTSCTEIVVNLPNADGSFLQLKKSLGQVSITGSPNLGQFVATFTSVQSALLLVGELQSLVVTFTIGGQIITVNFPNCFSVFQV